MKFIKSNWHRMALLLILILSGFLTFYEVWKEGYANTYYSACVKSMLTSWHNFFFVSFDAGGYVSVDKPALGLWLQAISAFIFGFHGWSLILPEALSAVVSSAIMYKLIRRTFGKAAGLAASLTLSLTPILVAVARTNNLDTSLVMVLMLAAWALAVSAEKSSFKMLLAAMALAGLGFNIKMLEAFMVLPAFYAVYMFAAPAKISKKIMHLTGATAVLLVVSLSWAAIVDLTPADERPYVGSSSTNSVLELALGYNGIQRVVGMDRGSVQGNAGNGANTHGSLRNEGGNYEGGDARRSRGQDDGGTPDSIGAYGNSGYGSRPDMQAPASREESRSEIDSQQPPQGSQPSPSSQQMQPPAGGGNSAGFSAGAGGGRGGSGENGSKSIFRIFNEELAGQISWLIPMALFGILILSLNIRNIGEKKKKAYTINLILWGTWLITMVAYFSIGGYFHRYYLSMLAPGVAALAGIGIVELWKAYMRRGWKCVLLPSAIGISAFAQACMLSRYPSWSKILTPIVCGIAGLSIIVLVLLRILKKDNFANTIRMAASAGFAALLIVPAVWSYTPIIYGSQTTLPVAGPELEKSSNRSPGENTMDIQAGNAYTEEQDSDTGSMVQYLLSNKQGEKYLVAVPDANTAAPIILETGEAVMAVGGFKGSDEILTVKRLEQMVKDGELRYFLISSRSSSGSDGGIARSTQSGSNGQGAGETGSKTDVTSWVIQHGTVVDSGEWTGDASGPGSGQEENERSGGMRGISGTLYDLASEKNN